jgi:hypothetical protein
VELLRRRPGLRGIVFDQPRGVAEASERLQAAGLAGRCRVVAGSFFQGVLSGGDAYVLASVLHAWEGPQARELLQAVRRVLPEHGRLLVVEEVLAAPNQPGGKVMDLLMAAVGGRERTWQEWGALLRPAPAQAQTVVTTRPTPNGGTTVRSVSVTQGLKGTGLVSGVSYRAVELSGTVVNQPPPPGTGMFFSTVTTLLIPQGSAAPSMLVVVVVVVVNGC